MWILMATTVNKEIVTKTKLDNLANSISIEAGELLECFQWNNNFNKDEVCEELADVFTYCIMMADKLGVDPKEIILKKLDK